MLLIATALLGALAHYALIKALDYAEAGAVQPYSYTLLVWVTLLGAVVFGDIPDRWTMRARRSWWRAVSTPGTTTGGWVAKRQCWWRATNKQLTATQRSADLHRSGVTPTESAS